MTAATGTRAGAAKSAAVTAAAQAYRVGVSFLSNILLARLLTPADFGLTAAVSTAAAFVWVVQELGLNQATIQRERISRAQISALFWVTAGFSLVLALGLALSAPAVAWFFGDPRILALTIAFAFLVVVSGVQSQQLALLNREMRFKAIAAIDVLSATASAATGVLVAWLTSSYWALFAGALASSLINATCTWTVSGFRPGRPSFEGDLKEILGFGSGVSGFNIVNYFARNADNLLIGRVYGTAQLGFYDRAYRLLLFPLEQIRNPLGRVMLPTLSRLQTDPVRYRRAFLECVSLMMLAVQPGLVFATIFADDIFGILFGRHWLPAVPIFQWLGICALHQIMTASVGWLFLSQGRGGDYFRIGLFNAATTIASFLLGLPWGAVGVAASYTISDYAIRLPATLWSAGRRGPVTARDLVAATVPNALATLISAAILMAAAFVLPTRTASEVVGLALLAYAIYAIVILAFPAKRASVLTNGRALASLLPSLGRA